MNAIDRYFSSTGTTETKKQSMKPLKNVVIIYRWVITILVLITSTQYADIHKYGVYFWLLVAALVGYNLTVTRLALKQWVKYSIANVPFLLLDVLFIVAFTLLTGGVTSDMYIILLIYMGSCILLRDAEISIKFGIFSTIAYILACISHSYLNSADYELLRLIIRAVILLIWSYSISVMNNEVSKYEEARNNEFRLARTDNLTGLANRLYFEQRLNVEKEYADRNDTVVNVMMFDLDDFKGFNDTYGHLAGDKLLKLFADIMKRCIRKYDIPVRYGGEEFFVFIRELDIETAKSIAERVRKQLEGQSIYFTKGDEKKKITVSCGIAQYPKHSNDIRKVIELADRALYFAKSFGKNQVVTYDEIANEIDS